MPRQFFIFAGGRTGKTHLLSLLNGHDGVVVHDEPLTRLIDRGLGEQERWLDSTFLSVPDPATAVGVASKVRSVVNLRHLRQLLVQNDVQIVLNSRRNVVKQTISEIRALELNRTKKTYNARTEAERLDNNFAIEASVFHHYLAQREGYDSRLREFVDTLRRERPVLEIHYEDLLSDESFVLRQIFSFIDVEEQSGLESGVVKNTSDNLREAVPNLDELAAMYVGTRYEKMFWS